VYNCAIDIYIYIYIYIYLYIYIYIDFFFFYFVSSPYLLVFGDDRVYGTQEQMLLQVDLVRLSNGARKTYGNNFIEFLSLMVLE